MAFFSMAATLYPTALALHSITIPSLSSPLPHSADDPPPPPRDYMPVYVSTFAAQSSVGAGFIHSKLMISASALGECVVHSPFLSCFCDSNEMDQGFFT